jgi:hypothetical protein
VTSPYQRTVTSICIKYHIYILFSMLNTSGQLMSKCSFHKIRKISSFAYFKFTLHLAFP